jgi:O-antigen/teichoic acid export membrane protein
MSQRRIVGNSLFVISGQLVGKACALGTSVLVARHFSVPEVGQFAYALAVAAFLGMWTEFGLSTVLVREIPQSEQPLPQILSGALAVKAANYALGLLVVVGWLWASGWDPARRTLILLLCAATGIDAVTQTLTAACNGREHFRPVVLSALALDVLRLGAVTTALVVGVSVSQVALAYVAASALVCLGAVLTFGRPLLHDIRRPSLTDLARTYRLASTFVVYGVLLQVYFRIDTLLLGALRPVADVALYATPYRLLEASLFVPAALMGVLLPHFSREAASDPARNVARLRRLLPIMFLVAFPGVLLVCALAQPIVVLLYGAKFAASGPVLAILIWTLGIICLNAAFPMFLNAMRHERSTVTVFLIAACANIVANLLLIPRFGATGAAAVTVATEVLNTGLYVHFLRRAVGPLGIGGVFTKMGLVTALSLVCWWLLRPMGVSVSAAGAVTVFLALAWLVRLLVPSTVRTLVPTLRTDPS